MPDVLERGMHESNVPGSVFWRNACGVARGDGAQRGNRRRRPERGGLYRPGPVSQMMRTRMPRSLPEGSAATGPLGKRRGVVAGPLSSHVRGVTPVLIASALPLPSQCHGRRSTGSATRT
jgi:hypothetical protein